MQNGQRGCGVNGRFSPPQELVPPNNNAPDLKRGGMPSEGGLGGTCGGGGRHLTKRQGERAASPEGGSLRVAGSRQPGAGPGCRECRSWGNRDTEAARRGAESCRLARDTPASPRTVSTVISREGAEEGRAGSSSSAPSSGPARPGGGGADRGEPSCRWR